MPEQEERRLGYNYQFPKNTEVFLRIPSLAVLAAAGLAAVPALFAADWKPVTPAELAQSAPKVEKDADAEALFWEVHVLDEAQSGQYPHSVFTHYVRIKIFTDRGKEKFGTLDIAYAGRTHVSDIAGRTTKANGETLELKKDAVFDRTLVRTGGLKVRAKSFAMPGVEPGSIIEYRWKESHEDMLADYVRIYFQRDIPVQFVKYYIKPLVHPYFPYGMRSITFHFQNSPFMKEANGFYSTYAENVPAFHEEPRMPAEAQVKPWMLLYYAPDTKLNPEKYWIERGRELYKDWKQSIKVNDEVRRAADKAIGDAKSDDERLRRLFEFCRREIKNTADQGSGLTAGGRSDRKENKTPADTLRQGLGTPREINLLFAALAAAAGFDVRLARVGDRDDVAFRADLANMYFLRSYDIAVKLGDAWKFFDAGSTYVPYGMLMWQEEGVAALVTDPREPALVVTPLSGPERSTERRRAALTLGEDGTVEGDVTIEYSGHFATGRKNRIAGDSDEKLEDEIKEAAKLGMSTAEVTNVKVENVNDPEKPLRESFHIRVPGYAQRTGKRLFVQPAFFQFNEAPLFTASERKYPIMFRYPWAEDDDVTIDIPAGYDLDNAEAPHSLAFGPIGKYMVGLTLTTDRRKLHYARKLIFGDSGAVYFPVEGYPQVKFAFDQMHQQDGHVVTLKQAGR